MKFDFQNRDLYFSLLTDGEVFSAFRLEFWNSTLIGGGEKGLAGGILHDTDTNQGYIKKGWKLSYI